MHLPRWPPGCTSNLMQTVTLIVIPACHSVAKGPLWPSNSTFFVNGPSSCWQDLFLQKVRRWNTSCILNHPRSVGTFILEAREVSVWSSGEAVGTGKKFRGPGWFFWEAPGNHSLLSFAGMRHPIPGERQTFHRWQWDLQVTQGDTLLGLSWAWLLLCQIFPLSLV